MNTWQQLLAKPVFWFAVAFLIRMLYLLEQGGVSPLFYQPLLDEKEALDSALALLRGDADTEPYFKAPGYAWIMAAVISVSGEAWPWTLRALQHACGAWLVWMIAWLAGRLSKAGSWRRSATGIAGALGTVYAPMIRLENNISLDFWVVFFQTAMLCLLVKAVPYSNYRWRAVAGAGCIAAAAWLTRPTLTLVLPFIAVWLAWPTMTTAGWTRKSIRRAVAMTALFLIPVLIAMGGVLIRNIAVSGEAMLLPWQGGYNFYYANCADATGRYYRQSDVVEESYANPTRHLAMVGFLGQLEPQEREQFRTHPDFGAINEFWFESCLRSIREKPVRWAGLMVRKAVYLFSDKEIYNYEDFDLQRSLSSLLSWMPGRFGLIFPLALGSLAICSGFSSSRRKLHWLLWLYIVTLGGAVALYYVSGRMRMPVAMPLVALGASGAAGFFHSNTRRKMGAATLLLLGIAISWGDWWGVRSESMAHVDLARMSNAAWHRERYEQALDLALKAESMAPEYPVIPRLKGQALYQLGHLEESLRQFELSVQLLGDDTSRRNLETVRRELRLRQSGTPPAAVD